ncbi:unnamed protein product [Prorocentrum cordatum]|uniref:Uncharacterized protein n=1 Tax=Prorocentrum cordatum TaxID=2364126 RepID=A0ABN9V6A7_9DINO|nr:unnamed protein product [Polarella glacialis]
MDKRYPTSGRAGALNSEWISTPSTFIGNTFRKRNASGMSDMIPPAPTAARGAARYLFLRAVKKEARISINKSSTARITPSPSQRGATPEEIKRSDDTFHAIPKEGTVMLDREAWL